MTALTERLEIRLGPHTLRQLKREAQERGISMAQVVREAIDLLLKEDRQARMRAAEKLFSVGASVADWDQMELEIEEAYRGKASGPQGDRS